MNSVRSKNFGVVVMETSVTLLQSLVRAPSCADWQRIVHLYHPLLTAWCRRAGVAGADCDDVVQDVLIVVFHRASQFTRERPGAFRAWLRTILENHLRNYFRKPANRVASIALESLTDDHSDLARLHDREHNEHLARKLMERVQNDFSTLTWTAFCEIALEGRSPAEVGRRLNISTSTAIQAKFRVLRRLRQESREWFEPR
jgi:RNA polymerase sigma-70 factor (ECF subfamily)